MRIRNLVLGTIVALGGVTFATSANADTSVFNRTEHRNIYNGRTETKVNSNIHSVSLDKVNSTSVKAESYGGTYNTSGAWSKGQHLSSDATSRGGADTKPVSIITTVNQNQFTRTVENTRVNSTTSFDFSASIFEHEAGSRSN